MKINIFALAALLLTLTGAPLSAQAQTNIGTFTDWNAFTDTEGSAKVCYVGAFPQKSLPDNVTRGKIYILVTHRPATKSLGVVSVEAGYTYKDGSDVDFMVEGKPVFKFFTKGGQAWTQEDAAVVNALKAGKTLTVKGTSSRGTVTTDTYSLAGFTAAYQAIDKACGITR
jgi:invasion protein IalB